MAVTFLFSTNGQQSAWLHRDSIYISVTCKQAQVKHCTYTLYCIHNMKKKIQGKKLSTHTYLLKSHTTTCFDLSK